MFGSCSKLDRRGTKRMMMKLIKGGPSACLWLLALAAQFSGYTNTALALFLSGLALLAAVVAAPYYFAMWGKEQGLPALTTIQVIVLIGIGGAWLFITLTLAAIGWSIWRGEGLTGGTVVTHKQEEGPLGWFYAPLEMEGGALQQRNVFALMFHGTNVSQKEVHIKKATITSAIKGTELSLEIVASNEVVPLDQIELIPPGAPITLVAKFGPPNPTERGKVLGIDPKTFLETWRQFFLNVQDDSKNYRLAFNEGQIAPFFPGMVGPHVTKKDQASSKPAN
jgi:hypothetical protein